MADVVLSYAHLAIEPTITLAAALGRRGYDVWWDRDLLPTANVAFQRVIEDQIDRARAVVVIWSAAAMASEWVYAEAVRAKGLGRLVSVRTPDVDPLRLPLPFNVAHTALVTDVDTLRAALTTLGVSAGPVQQDPATLAWEKVQASDEAAALERFLVEHGDRVPALAEAAEARLAKLDPTRPRRRAAGGIRPEDVLLRFDAGMHTATIHRVSVSANGRRLATASADKTVRLWRLPDGVHERTLRPPIGPGDEGKVYAVALDPAGRWVACGGWTAAGGHNVTVFDAAHGAVRARLGPLPEVVPDLEVSADGTRLAAGLGGKNGVRVWDTRGWGEVWSDKTYGDQVYGLAFAADGRLATTCFDGLVRLHAPDGQVLHRVRAPGGARPYGIAWSPDGRHLAIGYQDAVRVDVLDGQDATPQFAADTSGLDGGSLDSVAWLESGALAAGGRNSGGDRLGVWPDGGRGRRVRWPGPQDTVMDLAPLPGGGVLVGSGEPSILALGPDGAVRLRHGPPMADQRGKRRDHFRASPDGARVWFGLGERSADPVLFDLSALELVRCPEPPAALRPPDTASLPIAGWENAGSPTLRGAPLALQTHEYSHSLAIGPDAAWFLLGTEWSLRRFGADGRQAWERPVPGPTWGVHLARAGRVALAAYGDGTIRWHDAADGRELLALFIHVGEATGDEPAPFAWVAFTPDGYFTASPEGRALVGWHVNRGPDHAADFFPVTQFAAVYERPDLVQAALDAT